MRSAPGRWLIAVLIVAVLVSANVPLRSTAALSALGLQLSTGGVGLTALAAADPGLTWTSRATPADNDWTALAWSPELSLFAAVASGGTTNRVMTSPDGVTWTARAAPSNNWFGIAWSAQLGLFAAVAASGTGNRVMTSPDGINWTSQSSPADNFWRAIAWSPALGIFAAVSIDGASRVMTSPDGINWTLRTAAAANEWRAITWAPSLGLFAAVAVSGTNNRVMTSPDGITWTSRVTNNSNWTGIAWAPQLGLFAAIGSNSAMTSTDGITWTVQSVPANFWYGVAWSPEIGVFAATAFVTGTGTRAMTSPDGINWRLNSTPADNDWVAVAWSPALETFAAVSITGSGNRVMTATDAQVVDFGSDKPFAFGAQAHAAMVVDPVNLATGSLTVRAQDLAIPGRLLDLDFTRWYNSADRTVSSLGPGWTHSYEWTLTDFGATVTLRRGDGRRDSFTRQPDGTYTAPTGVFDTLTRNTSGTFTLTATTQVRFEFSATGVLLSMREPAGNQLTFGYSSAKLATITDTVGRQIALTYNAQNRLSQLQDPLGRRVTYGYDATGRLTSVTDRVGNGAGPVTAHQWKYTYDGTTRHIRTIVDPDNRTLVTNTYDAQGRVIEQRDGLSALTTIAYSAGQTILTDPRGHARTYTFDARMRVLTQVDVVGANTYTLAYEYDAAGNRTRVTDRNAKSTDFTYDSRGNLLTKTDPSPDGVAPRPVTTFSYDLKNNLTQVTDAANATTTYTYDASTNVLTRLARDIDATTTAVVTFDYLDPGNPGLPTRVIAPRGNTTGTPNPTFGVLIAYDAQGNPVRRTDADGATASFAYDGVGRLTSFVDPAGNVAGGVPTLHTWSITYDENDRVIARGDPLGGTIRNSFDGVGNRVSTTDRNGNVTTYSYDGNARLATVQQRPDPLTNPLLTYTTSVARDGNGNVTGVTQANGVITAYAFDALDRLTTVTTYPAPATPVATTYTLDANGLPLTRATADGVTVNYAYDALARLTTVTGPSLSISYTYDALGRRLSMTDATGTTTYQYDRLSRPTQIASPAGILTYAYDRDGNRTQITYPGGDAVAYTYSPGGRLQTVTDWAARVTSYAYHASGQPSSVTYPNGHRTAYAFDRAQRLTGITTADASGLPWFSQTYVLDLEGNRLQRVDAPLLDLLGITSAQRYDGLNRLLSVDRVSTATGQLISGESFSFDPGSNMTARTGPSATFSYDGANRLTHDGAVAYTFSSANRLIQRGSDTFAYDALGRLTSASVSGGGVSYAYDGDGLLYSRTTSAGTSMYLWDSVGGAASLLKAGTDRVVHGLGPIYRVQADGSTRTFISDAQGSVRAEVSDLGTVTSRHDYLAFGELRTGLPFSAPALLGYAGELRDPITGFVYLRSRWYDPATGRFTSRDALGGSALEPTSLNAYAYGDGNPVNRVDPSGHCTGAGGAIYCIERWIPTRTVCPQGVPICGLGDNGIDPMAEGGTFRVRQLIFADGSVRTQLAWSHLDILGGPALPGSGEGCSTRVDLNDVDLSCTAFNGWAWIPGGPRDPIRTRVKIVTIGGRTIVSASGTFYPSLSVHRYGSNGPQLLFFYDASAVGFEGLTQTGILRNNRLGAK